MKKKTTSATGIWGSAKKASATKAPKTQPIKVKKGPVNKVNTK